MKKNQEAEEMEKNVSEKEQDKQEQQEQEQEQKIDVDEEQEAKFDEEEGNEEELKQEEETSEEDSEAESEDIADSDSEKLSEMKDKYLRMYSEFENFRRRTAKEKLDLINSANEELMASLLPVLDDFERALESSKEVGSEKGSLKEGFDLIYQKFSKILEAKGLKEIECGPGSEFDTELHEAISQIPAPKKKLKGKIVDVVEKGYYLKDKVIRFAKVVVGS